MYARMIEYEDYNGTKREEEFLFNMNEAELTMWMMTDGDYSLNQKIKRIAQKRNGREVMDIFEDFIRRTYGEVSLDGKQFVKNDEVWERFRYSNAFSVLFMELVTDAAKGAEFINSVIPKELADAVAKAIKENPDGIPDEMKDYTPALDLFGSPE